MYEPDIEKWIKEHFSDSKRVREILVLLQSIDTAINLSRIVRCVLSLSKSDYDTLLNYTIAAVEDPRDVIFWAEYDDQDILVRDFNKSLYKQKTN